MRLTPGTRVGAFEIVEPIGSGGMGEVYRARDATLARDVALKVLPASLASDPDRLARFRREARLLASLNHPHIGSIYGFEEADGVPALVLELIEGPTLAERIGGQPIGLSEALAIARQIADALDAAHEAGVIHRDLKPGNIKVRPDGTVKILDFGLAKALSDAGAALDVTLSPTITAAATADGAVLGTPAYMSPEQARGQAADKRADIWSFGCVLYEMLTGRRAFEARTVSDTIVAVLSGEPDWTALPADTPRGVRRLLRRCLERDPKRRLRDIGDALPDVAGADTDPPASSAVHAPAHPLLRWTPWIVAAAAVIAAGVLAWRDRGDGRSDEGMAQTTLEQLTYDGGLTTMPALSPDGNLLAYASDRAGRGDLDIWVQRIGGGAPLRLTDDPADDQTPDFSPDGNQIVFRSERAGGGIYVVPALGGPVRRIGAGRDPKFAPDGKRIAYWSGAWRGVAQNLRSSVFVASLGGGEPTRIVPQFRMARNPVWSPDGQLLMILGRRDEAIETFDWWQVPLDGQPPVQTGMYALAGRPEATFSSHAWRSPSTVVVSAGGYNLWSVQLSSTGQAVGPVRPLTAVTGDAFHPAVSRDGTIVFAAVNRQRVIARARLGAGADHERPVPVYSDDRPYGARSSASADGSVLIFEQWFPRHREIWQKNLRSGQQEMVVRVDDTAPLNPTVSPDGARLAYTERGEGQPGTAYVVELSGGVPRRVCEKCSLYGFLSDNRRVLESSRQAIRTIDIRDGATVDIVRADKGGLGRPHISPDDRWIAFRHGGEPSSKIYIAAVTPGAPATLASWQLIEDPTTTGRPAGWSLDSKVLYLLLDTDGFRCLWGQRIDTASGRLIGAPFAARHFHDINEAASTSFGNPITSDGFVFETMKRTGNLWKLTSRN
jgi:Tol biopolymer transport system component